MVRAYSLDLRERVVDAVEAGGSVREVSARFGVSVSSVVKWHQRWRLRGNVEPDAMGGHRTSKLAGERDYILEQIRRDPHVSIRGLCALLERRGVVVSRHGVWSFVRREGLSFKKKPLCP